MICDWCDRSFRPRRGGSPQRFCGTKCRMAFWAELRRWGERALDAGVLTIDDIRNVDLAACTLLVGASSGTPVGEAPPQRPALVAPRQESRFAQDEFERLLARTIANRRR
jgi:hypothetical protein